MAATVRIFTFPGVIGLPRAGGYEPTSNVVQTLKFPALGRALLSCTLAAAATSEASAAPKNTGCLWVQVQRGKTVYFEIVTPSVPAVEASITSPLLTGETQLLWGEGWRLSVLEAPDTE